MKRITINYTNKPIKRLVGNITHTVFNYTNGGIEARVMPDLHHRIYSIRWISLTWNRDGISTPYGELDILWWNPLIKL